MSKLKEDIYSYLDIISDIDSESDPIIGPQIKEYNMLRETQIKNNLLLKKLTPSVNDIINLIEYS